MCYAVYLSTDLDLKTSAWDKDNRDVYVEEVGAGPDADVKKHFTGKNAYYVGSSLGCGCGFKAPEPPFFTVDEAREYEESRENVRKFCALLDDVLSRSPKCEVFLCWDGDHGLPLERREEVPAVFFREGGWVEDRPVLYVVKR